MRRFIAAVIACVALAAPIVGSPAPASAHPYNTSSGQTTITNAITDCSQIRFNHYQVACFDMNTGYGPIFSVWSAQQLVHTGTFGSVGNCWTLGPNFFWPGNEWVPSPWTDHTSGRTTSQVPTGLAVRNLNTWVSNWPLQCGNYPSGSGYYGLNLHFNGSVATASWAWNAAQLNIPLYFIIW